MTVYTQACINLHALQHNFALIQQLASKSARQKTLLILKCNAYGHGAEHVMRALPQADAWGVARVEESLTLRKAGATQPIVVLCGMRDAAELQAMYQAGLQPVIHQQAQVTLLQQSNEALPDTIWLKYDSGMHRLGFDEKGLREAYQRLKMLPGIKHIIFMSHFAQSEAATSELTQLQLQRYHDLKGALGLAGSLSNSAAISPTADSTYALGYFYFYGIGTARDPLTARHYFQVAASKGNLKALAALRQLDAQAYAD